MSKIEQLNTVWLDAILMLILFFSLVLSLLPLHLAYKENISLLFLVISIGLFVYSIRCCFVSRVRQQGHNWTLILLVVLLIYLVIQLLPIPLSLMSSFSNQRSEIWQLGAYGLNGYTAISLDLSAGIWFVIMFICYLCVFMFTLRLVTTQKRIFMFLVILFCLGIYQIIFDMVSKSLGYQYVSASQMDGHSYRLTGTFINSNNLSALINISIAAGMTLLVMLIQFRKANNAVINTILIAVVIVGEILLLYGSIKSGSAGGFLSLLAATSIVGLLFCFRQFSVMVLLSLLGFLACIAVLLVFYSSREINIEELTRKLTLSGRPALWAAVVNMWKDFPVFGIGAGAFEWVFPSYKTDQLSPLRIVNAHSSYFNLLVETGLIGVFILTMVFCSYVSSVIKSLKISSTVLYLVGSLMIGWLAFMIHEVVENNLLLPSVTMPFFCLMGVILALVNINFKKGEEV